MLRAARAIRPEPAICGLCGVLVLWLAACASTPSGPLEDLSYDTDYRLDAVAEILREADYWDARGKRATAATLLETALAALPADHVRERHYIDALLAAVWGRDGQGRDLDRAREFLDRAWQAAQGDARLRGDVLLARVVLQFPELEPAADSAEAALDALAGASAWGRYADACRELTSGFADAGDGTRAMKYARKGRDVAERMGEPERALRAWIDIADLLVATDLAAADDAFLRAYLHGTEMRSVGWRNVVIARAIAGLDGRDDARLVKWGERLRTGEFGELPGWRESGLQLRDYACTLGRYALAAWRLEPDSERTAQVLVAADTELGAISERSATEKQLADEVQDALLKNRAGK